MGRLMGESNNNKSSDSIKFLCSYGGKILLPRLHSDYKLRYVGGNTRIFSVNRSVSYTELMVKLVEFCGFSVTLKCQLPDGDLDTLISVKSDEELASIIEEYQKAAARLNASSPIQKIRAVLAHLTNLKTISPPLSTSSSVDYSAFYRSSISDDRLRRQVIGKLSSHKNNAVAIGFPVSLPKSGGVGPCYYDHRPTSGFCSGSCCNYLPRLQYGMRLPTH